jgi:hypothetical protein
MQTVFNFFIRVLLLAAGLVFAASLAVVATGLLALWGVRAVWCKLTGQPINPFVVRMRPGAGFDTVFRSRQSVQPNAAASHKPGRVGMDDVTDVEPKR